ncbi:MAG TPA: PLP-dependent transferase, partial [Bacillota bacterium]|nr:PLP-dependent transferase [Bacillota bacterium]
ELRVARHCENARAVAEFLVKHPKVEKVYYPGFKDHPGHDIAACQMKGFGGIVSFEVKGGRQAGAKLANSLEMITLAVSLGDAETLIEHPASMTHSAYSPEDLEKAGIPAGLIRISAGLENAEDIIADLDKALAKL